MSNENSTVNSPRHNRLIRSSARSRCFSCITYLDEMQLKLALLQHGFQIRVYAYAYHDMDTYEDTVTDTDSGEVLHQIGDLKEPHFHLILVLHNANTVSAIRRWFFGFKDGDNQDINTLVQVCRDKNNAFDYLTHSTPDCLCEGKYIYPDNIVVSNDIQHFKGHYSADLDTTTLMMLDFCKGVSYQEMMYKYGKHFILNFDKLKTLATEMYYRKCFDPSDGDPFNTRVVYHTDYTDVDNSGNVDNLNNEPIQTNINLQEDKL